jgi:hypothetical protein
MSEILVRVEPLRIGIVGHEGAKFTPAGEAEAREFIRKLLTSSVSVKLVSGACHLGGIDIWAEEEADALGVPKEIYPPKRRSWYGGYRARNIQIAKASDEVHVIVVKTLAPSYSGMRFDSCYHCKKTSHVKSGGCWTGWYAMGLGKPAWWKEIPNV